MVIGGSGLIGSKLVRNLLGHGHQAVSAALDSGVNTLTGEGLAEALDSADVVVDVSNSPSLEGAAALKFFETSTGNIVDGEAAAGVGHHVALSVVGTERLSESGYFRAKSAQEKLIQRSSTRSSTLRSSSSSSRESPTTRPRVVLRPHVTPFPSGPTFSSCFTGFAFDEVVRRLTRAPVDPAHPRPMPLAK